MGYAEPTVTTCAALAGGKPVNGGGVEGLARLQLGRRKRRVIGRVRKVLRLQAECIAMVVNLTAGAGNASVEEVASIELDSRLIGEYFQHAPCRRLVGFGRQLYFLASALEHPILVVSVSQFQLLVVGINARPNDGRFEEVEWRASHRRQFAGGNQIRIYRRVAAGINFHLVAKNVTVPLAFEVEV